MIYASHGIGDSGKWIMDIVEKRVKGFTVLIVSKAKKTISSLKVNTANNVITLLFYILTYASRIFFRLLLNLICNLIYS